MTYEMLQQAQQQTMLLINAFIFIVLFNFNLKVGAYVQFCSFLGYR